MSNMNELPQLESEIDDYQLRRELAAELRACLDLVPLTPTEQENQ